MHRGPGRKGGTHGFPQKRKLYGKFRKSVGEIMGQRCKQKRVETCQGDDLIRSYALGSVHSSAFPDRVLDPHFLWKTQG